MGDRETHTRTDFCQHASLNIDVLQWYDLMVMHIVVQMSLKI